MSEFIAGAFIDVRPETRHFRADLKRGVDDAIKSANLKVAVSLDTKKLKADLSSLARGATVKVQIESATSIAALRKDLKRITDGAAQGLKIKIPVEVVQPARGKVAQPNLPTPAAVKVPIVPGTSVAELKREFDTRIKAATRDLKVKVPVEAQAVHSGKITGPPPTAAAVKVPIEPGTSVADLKRAFRTRIEAATKDLKVKVPVDAQVSHTGKVAGPLPTAAAIKVPISTSTSIADLKKEIKGKIDGASKGQKIIIPIEVKGIEKIPKVAPARTVAAAATPPPAAKVASATKGEAIKVPLVISTTVAELKTAIKNKIDSAVKGLKVVIPIETKGAIAKPAPLTKAVVQPNVAPTAAAAATGKAVSVPITISTTVEELKKAIKSKIDSATKGQKIVVPIEVKQTGKVTAPTEAPTRKPSSRGTAGGTDAGAVDQVDKANQKAEKSSKKLTEAQKRQALVSTTAKKSENDLAIATRLFAQANDAGITSEERTQRLREARAAATKSAKGANELLATSEKTLTTAQRSALENRVALAQSLRTDITAKQELVAADKAATAVTKQSSDARLAATTVIGFEAKEITDLNSLHLKENEVLAAEAAVRRQTNAARKLGLTSIAQENEAVLKEIATQKEAIRLQRLALKGDSQRARSQKTAGRGAASAILSLLGIRGATLASSAAFLVGAASAAVFTKAVADFASFEQELNVFQATTGATATQMERVAKIAHQLGADITLPAVSAADAAQAMSQLARAGLSVEDSIQGARGVLELASAAMISNADAAELTASALNAFGLEGEDAVHVADLLANAANNAQGSISEMGAAMQQASAIAHQVGFSLDDTIATLTIFARHGLRGSDAGTSLRTALSRLIAPTHKAAELIGELGLNIRDANGDIKPDIFAQFGEATKDLSPALRDMIAETIAGQDAIRAFAIGASEGRRGLKLAQLQMEATGTAAAIAAARSKGLSGSFSALSSNSETLGTSLGKLASGPVKGLVGELNATLVAANQLASGDFSGFADGIEKDFDQAGANIARHFGGLKKILTGTDFSSLGSGFKELVTPADDVDKETSRINKLSQALQDLQGLRVQAFTIGADITPITAKIQDIRRQLKEAKVDAGLLIPVTPLEKALAKLRTAQKTAQDIKTEILATGGSAADPFVKQLDILLHNIAVRIKITTKTFKDNAKNMGKAVEEIKAPDLAKAFQKEFDLIAQQPLLATPEVLSSIGDMARKIKSTGAPLTGAAGKEMGQNLIATLTTIIAQAVEDDNSDLAQDVKALGLKIAPLFGAGIAEGFKNLKVPLTDQQLEDALLPARIKTARAEAFGTVSDQIAAKQNELDALNKQLTQVVKGSDQEETILGKISAAKDAIRSLREGQAADQQKKDTASDKKVTDALSARERTLTQALDKAQATETLKDDLRRERDLHAFYLEEIKIIKATVKDKETRDQAVQAAEDDLFKIDQQFDEDRAGRRAQLQEAALKPIQAGIDRAAETETLKDDVKQANRKVRFWQTQVRILKDLVKQRKATADELKTAQTALDDAEKDAREARKGRKQQVIDDREQALQFDIEFAQTTENKGKELRARNAFIAFLEQQKKHFKGNVIALKGLRNQIAEQKKAIKELKGETDKGDKGTTVFELLQQNAETFKANAGNLISGQQPFAGPAGFTADIAQFLIRQKNATKAAKAAAKSAGSAGDPSGLRSAFVGPAGLSTFATESAEKVSTIADAARSAFVGPNGVSTFATQAAKDLKIVGDAALVTASKIKQIAETPAAKTLFTTGQPAGLVKAGNINLLNRPNVKNPKGGFSSVLSETVGIGDKKHPGLTAVIPTVLGNTKSTKGEKPRIVSPDEALKHFKETGENLGIFASLAAAEKYSDLLHQQQARLGSQRRNLTGLDPTAAPAPTSTDAVKRTDFSALTGAVVKLTNVLERQPGTGKTSTTSARREPDKQSRVHYQVASASRRVVEERIGGV